jgi:hypothetical protein
MISASKVRYSLGTPIPALNSAFLSVDFVCQRPAARSMEWRWALFSNKDGPYSTRTSCFVSSAPHLHHHLPTPMKLQLDGICPQLLKTLKRYAPILVAAIGLLPAVAAGQHSVARQWDEAILDAIRIDTPRPPVHARNLYHLSAGMYDAWAAFDPTAKGVFVHEKHLGGSDAARNEVISYAAYRILSHRYALSVNAAASQIKFDNLMSTLGYDKAVTSTVGDSPAAIGNRIAQSIINASVHDGSNEANNYADTTGYTSVNVPMIAGYPTATVGSNCISIR